MPQYILNGTEIIEKFTEENSQAIFTTTIYRDKESREILRQDMHVEMKHGIACGATPGKVN